MLVKERGIDSKTEFVKWFSELNKSSGKISGGKGANLAEIFNLHVPVPPGFVITAQAYDYFIKKAGLDTRIKLLLEKINYEDTKELDKVTKQIREMIETAKYTEEMKDEILEAYEILGTEGKEVKEGKASAILAHSQKNAFVAVRSSATTEDLAEASFAGQQESFLNVRGKDELLSSIKKCFASLFTPRATYYRNKKGFGNVGVSLAVVVQRMINSEKSGVIFTKDPSMNREGVVIEAVWGLGEGIVSGRITPDRYLVKNEKIKEKETAEKKIAFIRDEEGKTKIIKLKEEKARENVLKDHETIRLAEIALKLEQHYKKPQDIEFAIENDEIYIVQTRPITTLGKTISRNGKEIKGQVVLTGLAASPGIGSGKVKIVHKIEDLEKVLSGDVLVTEMTNPDMVVTMQRCSAIVTDEGGITAHAAIVSREMGIPAVVGTEEATKKLKEGEIVTVDGFAGKVYAGKVSETVQKEIKPVTNKTKTKIKVIIDLPTYAEHASKTGLRGIGLARIEGIIAESGKHPYYFLEKKKMKDYEEIIFKGIKKLAEYFDEIWVRTSDIRSDEFKNLEGAPKKIEANPMLGMHGIRFSLKHPEILKAEIMAMKRVAEHEKGKTIGIMFPQIISLEEVKKAKEFVKEAGFQKAKIGVMIETPAAVQVIDEICAEKVDFISFGTNDLTQFTLAIDRGNEEVQDLYNEMNPAILHQLASVIRACKRSNTETSICGQSGSKKEMVKFLVEHGIDSISVNSDVAADISEYVAELEKDNSKSQYRYRNYGPSDERPPKKIDRELKASKPVYEEDITKEDLPVIPGTEADRAE